MKFKNELTSFLSKYNTPAEEEIEKRCYKFKSLDLEKKAAEEYEFFTKIMQPILCNYGIDLESLSKILTTVLIQYSIQVKEFRPVLINIIDNLSLSINTDIFKKKEEKITKH